MIQALYRYELPQGTVLEVPKTWLISLEQLNEPFTYSCKNEFNGKLHGRELQRNKVKCTGVEEKGAFYYLTVELTSYAAENLQDNSEKTRAARSQVFNRRFKV